MFKYANHAHPAAQLVDCVAIAAVVQGSNPTCGPSLHFHLTSVSSYFLKNNPTP